MENKNLIVVEQLPIIKEQLKAVSIEIKKESDAALSLVCNVENKQAVKEARAKLSKKYNALETQRKTAKKEVLKPYEEFERIYKENITEIYSPTDKLLKERIEEIENIEKEAKYKEVETHFKEYCNDMGIDFVTLQQTGVNVTLSASISSLKDVVTEFLQGVRDSLVIIETQQYKDEILVEYKKTLNCSNAITTVIERHKELEELEAKRKQEADIETQVEDENIPQQESVVTVKKEVNNTQEDIVSIALNVSGTIPQIRALRNFMDVNHIVYE